MMTHTHTQKHCPISTNTHIAIWIDRIAGIVDVIGKRLQQRIDVLVGNVGGVRVHFRWRQVGAFTTPGTPDTMLTMTMAMQWRATTMMLYDVYCLCSQVDERAHNTTHTLCNHV